jgi:hypothetical protein
MYATSVFHFNTTDNGYLMFGISLIRGLFLLFLFPRIIKAGRIWFNGSARQAPSNGNNGHDVPTHPEDFAAAEGGEVPQEPVQSPGDEEDSGTGFDLLFVRWGPVVDSLVMCFAGFSSAGWQVYLAGFLQPFASGSAPAASTTFCVSYFPFGKDSIPICIPETSLKTGCFYTRSGKY